MSSFLDKLWIQEAVLCERKGDLPMKVKAYVVKIEDENHHGEYAAVIADNALFIKATFTQESVLSFLCNDTCEEMDIIIESLIILIDYNIVPNIKDKNHKEFIVVIKSFKLFGIGLDIPEFGNIHSSMQPLIANRLEYLWETEQLLELCQRYSPSFPDGQDTDDKDPNELLQQLSKIHLTVCQFNLSQQYVEKEIPVGDIETHSGEIPVFSGEIPVFSGEAAKLDTSGITNASTISELFLPENLYVSYFEPLIVDFTDNESTLSKTSQLMKKSEDELSSVHPQIPLALQESHSLSMLIGVCDASLIATQTQESPTKIAPRAQPQMSQGSNVSRRSREIEENDLTSFIDQYWKNKYQKSQLSDIYDLME